MASLLAHLLASPLGWPFARLAPRFAGCGDVVPAVEVIDAALRDLAAVRFVAAPARPGRRRRDRRLVDPAAYDASIVERGEVPTRPGNAHDFANALVWAVFPESKRAHHARQLGVVRASARPGEPWARTEEGDALAMLDEGGIVVVTPPDDVASLQQELARGDDDAVGARAAAGHAIGVVFGHSIVEHLGRGDGAAVAGLALALPGDPSAPDLRALDAALAERIRAPGSFLTRRGHGIASARPDVLGAREVCG